MIFCTLLFNMGHKEFDQNKQVPSNNQGTHSSIEPKFELNLEISF